MTTSEIATVLAWHDALNEQDFDTLGFADLNQSQQFSVIGLVVDKKDQLDALSLQNFPYLVPRSKIGKIKSFGFVGLFISHKALDP